MSFLCFCFGKSSDKYAMLSVDIVLINSSVQATANVSKQMTVKELKQHIYLQTSEQLSPIMMNLSYKGTKLMDTTMLKDIEVSNGERLRILQHKADLMEALPPTQVNAQGVDSLTEEIGAAVMPCGHQIGRESMVILIKSEIDKKKYEISCPYSSHAVWDFALCKKVGVLTKSETQEFEDKLSINWSNRNTKICPGCQQSVAKINLSTNRVVCPKCKLQFCFSCLTKWTSSNSVSCSSQTCNFLRNFVTNDTQGRVFSLLDPKDGKKKQYNTPKYRVCIYCFSMIENVKQCKHMPCKFCKQSFCWICLAKPNGTIYSCGDPYVYCGKIAPVQKFA